MSCGLLTIPTTATRLLDRRGRALDVVDIEDLLALTHGATVAPIAGRLHRAIAETGQDDQLVVASDATRLFQIHTSFPDADVRMGIGPDGADRALGSVVDIDFEASRFGTRVIGSVDGWFTEMVEVAVAAGLQVVVMSRADGLSNCRRLLAHEVVTMPEAADLVEAA